MFAQDVKQVECPPPQKKTNTVQISGEQSFTQD